MSDIIIYMTVAFSLLILIFILSLFRRKTSSEDKDEDVGHPAPRREPAPVRRVAGRVVRSRLHRARQPQEEDFDEDRPIINEDEEEIGDEDPLSSIVLPDGKIGVKKRKKLEMKAEKRASREQEVQDREERKQRQAALEEKRKAEDEEVRLEEQKQKEEEQRLKEEKERREHEEYLKLKESFQIESEGFDEEAIEKEGQDLYRDFINYIKNEKVVLLENLAARFKLKTQEAIDRLNTMLEAGDLTGVIDDRGKFIYISQDELEAVAKFIRQRGRVTISELAESSNVLINMNPNQKPVKSGA